MHRSFGVHLKGLAIALWLVRWIYQEKDGMDISFLI